MAYAYLQQRSGVADVRQTVAGKPRHVDAPTPNDLRVTVGITGKTLLAFDYVSGALDAFACRRSKVFIRLRSFTQQRSAGFGGEKFKKSR